MKLHLDLLLTAILVASAGSELVARDSFAAAESGDSLYESPGDCHACSYLATLDPNP